jgi:hypothetical protein
MFDTAFEHGFDYILRMDDDVHGHPPKAFTMLLEADKDVIGAVYPMRHFPYTLCALKRTAKDENLVEGYKNDTKGLSEIGGKGVQEVDQIGFGMTLIKTQAFKQLPRPIFNGPANCPDDTYFAQLCSDNKIQQHAHMDIKLCHREVTPMNRLYLFNADARGMLMTGMIRPGLSDYDNRLVEMFGEDGRKDMTELKFFGQVSKPTLYVPSM